MKQTTSFILGALLMIAIGAIAQSSGVVIFKPSVPRQVMVDIYCCTDNSVKQGILGMVKQGWIVKSASIKRGTSDITSEALVVYEKY